MKNDDYNGVFDSFYDELSVELDSEYCTLIDTKIIKTLQQEIEKIEKNISLFENEIKSKIFIDEEMKKLLMESIEEYKKQKKIKILHKYHYHVISINEMVLDKLNKNNQTVEIIFAWKKIINPVMTLLKKYSKEVKNNNLKFEALFKYESLSFFETIFNVVVIKQFEIFLNDKYACKNIHIYPFLIKYE